MLLLVAGSTETARCMIVDEFLGEHSEWRHLALEDVLGDDGAEDDVLGIQQTFSTMIACECAKDVLKEGLHVVITCPSLDMLETVQEQFPEGFVTVHLGDDKETPLGFDHVIDSASSSMSETCAFLKDIVAKSA